MRQITVRQLRRARQHSFLPAPGKRRDKFGTFRKGDEERIRAAGCDGYIAKPLAYQNLLAVVSAHLVPAPS